MSQQTVYRIKYQAEYYEEDPETRQPVGPYYETKEGYIPAADLSKYPQAEILDTITYEEYKQRTGVPMRAYEPESEYFQPKITAEAVLKAYGLPADYLTGQQMALLPPDVTGKTFRITPTGEKIEIAAPPEQKTELPPSPEVTKAGCFIATAAYGTPLCPQLTLIRRFRDRCLPSRLSRAYYRISPPVAYEVSLHLSLRRTVRLILYPIVKVLKVMFDGEG